MQEDIIHKLEEILTDFTQSEQKRENKQKKKEQMNKASKNCMTITKDSKIYNIRVPEKRRKTMAKR